MTTFTEFGQGKQTLIAPKLSFMGRLLALPSYHWLLLAVSSLSVLHVGGVPSWLIIGLLVSAVMQKPAIKATVVRLSKNRLKTVYYGVQVAYLVFGALTIWLSFNKSFGVDVAVCFLLLVATGKVWELYKKRDAYVLINLALFVLASAFLMRQSLGVVLIGLFCLIMLLMAFIVISDDDNATGAGRVRALSMLTVPAIPLLVVLFVFFPRLPPLWSLPMAGKNATTGMSDSMSPGDFSNLSQSTELAFRVEFDGTPPNRHDMYWRGLVFSDFDGVTWRASDLAINVWTSQDSAQVPPWAVSAYQGAGQGYHVRLEPTEQNWLFVLEHSRPQLKGGLGLFGDFTLRSAYPISQAYRYRADYYGYGAIEPQLNDMARRINLRLPEQGNDKSHAFAKELFAKSGGDPAAYINAVQQYISTQGFSYTLSPPVLQQNRIDEFLFGTRAGFCEHYASSFTFLMRSAGVPARVVVGYQGGELGRDGTSWEVRQMDAHAWSEVWLEGHGWVRIDPTAFIAPDRIQNGMNALTEQSGAQMFGDGVIGQWSYQQFRMLQTLRRYSDQLSYYWQRDVVGYDQDKQRSSLFKWFNIKSFAEQFWTLISLLFILIALFVAVSVYRRKKRHHALDLPLIKLEKQLIKFDQTLAKAPYEPYLSWLDRVDGAFDDREVSLLIDELKGLYRNGRYGQDDDHKYTAKQMNELVKTLIA